MRRTCTWSLALVVAGLLSAGVGRADTSASPEQVARAFYDAFCRGDTATMERLYAPDVAFRDEIFAYPDRAGTMGMWRVLHAPGNGAAFSYEVLGVEGDTVTVRWLADYRFPSPRLGRKVHNDITATLVVRDGLIVSHVDAFPWDRWARQAFPLGGLSSWKPMERLLKGALRFGVDLQARRAQPAPTPGLAGSLGG
ncbi:MAG: nuclear transport factor 2 family protein [Planctomycetes bacterium]|nr:nuclear transport factor 2 family protein [Planctomycetota bacterium]